MYAAAVHAKVSHLDVIYVDTLVMDIPVWSVCMCGKNEKGKKITNSINLGICLGIISKCDGKKKEKRAIDV